LHTLSDPSRSVEVHLASTAIFAQVYRIETAGFQKVL
jgi:hypothetical protein